MPDLHIETSKLDDGTSQLLFRGTKEQLTNLILIIQKGRDEGGYSQTSVDETGRMVVERTD